MRVRSRLSVLVAAIVIGVWGAGCGSGSSAGGGGGSGGSADGGSGGGGGGGTDGGSVGTDGGGGGSSDGGTADGGTGRSECDGIVPAQLGGSFTFEVPRSSTNACDSATSDESGNIAAGVGTKDPNYVEFEWRLFDSNGTHQARITASELLPQGRGFEGLYSVQDGRSVLVGSWSPDGKLSSGPVVGGDRSPARGVRTWSAGLLSVTTGCSPNLDQATFTLRKFDASPNELAHAAVSFACVKVAGAVGDANGNWLLLVSGTGASSAGFAPDDLVGYWFDSSGRALTGWFRLGPGGAPSHSYLVHALIGGGAAVQIDGAWTYFVPSGKAEAHPAPSFLVTNPQADFMLVRGARAYAVLPRAGDQTELKLYSSSGSFCGSVRFSGGGLTTGADGSVIASSGANGCTKTVWPGLLS